MGGRADYQERQKARKIRYEELSKKAEERARKFSNSTANRILAMTPRTTNYNWSSFRKES